MTGDYRAELLSDNLWAILRKDRSSIFGRWEVVVGKINTLEAAVAITEKLKKIEGN